jgi:hypothetical protein
MNFESIVIRNLPCEAGATVTYGQLRERTRIKRGLWEILDSLKQKGKLLFQLDAHGHIYDHTVITIC